MTHLEVRLMGPFEACAAGKPITTFESNKVRAMLAYLMVEAGRPHSRQALIGLFWPAYSQEKAQVNLRHVLSCLRRLVGEPSTSQPFLLITRETVRFNPDSDFELDTAAFEAMVTGRPGLPGQGVDSAAGIQPLIRGVALLRGPFLEGFSLPDSPGFEEWALLQRERLNHLASLALQRITERLTALGEYEQALAYAWRQVALEPWMEEAHQQVMRLLALSGQRSAALAHMETCRRWLTGELGVEPGGATVHLYQQILNGEFSTSFRLPDFLRPGQPDLLRSPVFVARQAEMRSLQRALDQALTGKGQVRFILGSPGAGKTALAEEFIRRSWADHPKLVAVRGNCQAYFGKGDPYLAFREVLEQLTGEVEERWRAGAISQEQAVRLWLAIPDSAKALALWGPALIDTFLPGERLLERARQTVASEPDWLVRLGEILKSRRGSPPASFAHQADLFHQYGNVLLELARQAPLVIFLDDLQWIDPGSLGLLFDLGRRLAGSRILILGAFRPEEVLHMPGPPYSGGSEGSRHPLAGLVEEFRLLFDEPVIDLDGADEREFIDAYLDSEPNRLSEPFRAALFGQTRGHPLFTLELLRRLQEKGDLWMNPDREWVASAKLSWEDLPPRVEAAIGERIHQLPEDLHGLLQAASVEGERFTLEVLEDIQAIGEKKLLQCLSEELDRHYHLVSAEGLVQLNGRRLSRYRFRHILFQRYLYHSLDPIERAHRHGQVGTALEKLYGAQSGEIAVQLAHHFERTGNLTRACVYLYQAGQQAFHLAEHTLAVAHFSRALEYTPETDLAGRFKLLLGRERVFHNTGQRQAQEKDLQALEALAQALGPTLQAQAALRRAHFCDKTWNESGLLQAAEQAISLGQMIGLEEVVIEGLSLKSLAYHPSDRRRAADLGEQALALARQRGLKALEADILRELGICYEDLDLDKARLYAEEARQLYRSSGDRSGEGRTLLVEAFFLADRQDYAGSLRCFQTSRRICHEVGNRQDEIYAFSFICFLYEFLGRPDLIVADLLEAAEWTRSLEVPHFRFIAIFHLAMANMLLGNAAQALAYAGQALEFHYQSRIVLLPEAEAMWAGSLHCLRGIIQMQRGQIEEAGEDYCQAFVFFQQAHGSGFQQLPWIFSAELALAQGETGRALGCIETGLPFLENQTCYYQDCTYFLEYLIAYRVLAASQDQRAAGVLAEAHRRLQEQASRITDEDLRRSFLETYPWTREITALWDEKNPA